MKKMALLIISLLSTSLLFSQNPGSLDLTFGTNGTLSIDIGGNTNYLTSSALQEDQKIVLAGITYGTTENMSFARLNPDGSLDPSFGSGGVITYTFNTSYEHMNAIAIQPDQKIIGLGYTKSSDIRSMIMVRLQEDGQFDPSFSSDGMLVIDFGPGYDVYGMDLVLQDDGKILGLGYVWDLSNNVHCALCRVNANGSMDNSFGNNGTLIMNLLSYDNYINNIDLQGENIIVGGLSYFDGDHFLTLARFTPEGFLDNSFGTNGVSSVEMVIDPWILSSSGDMCLDEEGRILYGTYYEGFSGADFAVYRFGENGAPDNSFGNAGLGVASLMAGDGYVYSICTQYDGKIIVAGQEDEQFTLARFTEDGIPDAEFGTIGSGIVNTVFGNSIYSLNMQDDGLIVAAGLVFNTNGDFGAARYHTGLNVDIEEPIAELEALNIYPNPAKDHVNISIPSGEEIQEISIYNQNGQRLIHKTVNSTRIDISMIPGGVYTIEVRNTSGITTAKFLKISE